MSATRQNPCRIGIDVGGTFTDFVLADARSGRLTHFKEPSVPEDPSKSVARGLPELLARAHAAPADVELVVHGTTLPLNALIQRRGARLGLVVSRGNRGILEIGRGQLPGAFSFLQRKEEVLVPRDLIAEISARLDFRGRVFDPFVEAELDAIAERFRRNTIDSVTVLLMHSYAQPDFEEGVAEALRRRLPGVRVSASSAIWPERREFERCSMALMNAFVAPMMQSYFDRLEASMAAAAITAPVYITSNNGGTLSLRTARDRPIDTVLSGPASGVVAASIVAGAARMQNILSIDMGGTSADVSVIHDCTPAQTTKSTVGGLPLIAPVVAVSAIGAGGGSIVWVDGQGFLKVGPHSAGASPGPASYGKGGTAATLTDCYLVAGYLRADRFLGGRMPLDMQAARRALEQVAERIGFTGADRVERTAEAALRIATVILSTEISRKLAQDGATASDFALIAFGGAGPTHGNHLAEESRLPAVLIPRSPSTFCALGAILSDVKRDFVNSRFFDISKDPAALAELQACYDRLQAEAAQWIASEGSLIAAPTFEVFAEMRYADQAYDLQIPLTDVVAHGLAVPELVARFEAAHQRVYNHIDPGCPVRVTAQRLRVTAEVPRLETVRIERSSTEPLCEETRPLFFDGAFRPARIFSREPLRYGHTIDGLAIIEQEDTAVTVLPGWQAAVDQFGDIILRPLPAPPVHAV
jgi:N-methylhydantoinase A